MYDIWLTLGARALPDFGPLAATIPDLATPAVHARILDCHPGFFGRNAGFLHLDVPLAHAQQVMACLRTVAVQGYIVPVIYRDPPVSRDQAQRSAEAVIAQRLATHPDKATFGPVVVDARHEHAFAWAFGSGSEVLQDRGAIPGAVLASIHKLDGRVLDGDEKLRMIRTFEQFG